LFPCFSLPCFKLMSPTRSLTTVHGVAQPPDCYGDAAWFFPALPSAKGMVLAYGSAFQALCDCSRAPLIAFSQHSPVRSLTLFLPHFYVFVIAPCFMSLPLFMVLVRPSCAFFTSFPPHDFSMMAFLLSLPYFMNSMRFWCVVFSRFLVRPWTFPSFFLFN